ncbi:antitoxin [Halomonas korlensis]|uniref:Antitoxin VapB n=1 Tax=Halomonas korlensis TaxID=463301 RepID=A0A1I7HAB6_9GAMM|nr:AbrB/MazE/SpoVT family DNA-binding domain-containing protein [Halomonas korlensis]SFU57627.1 antitoxin VapB [Halomonas korlensis]
MSTSERHIRLFRNGRNQALRIPREFELEGEEAIIHKEGDRLIVEPIRKGRLLALLTSMDPLTEPFPDIDDNLPSLDEVQLQADHATSKGVGRAGSDGTRSRRAAQGWQPP